MNESVKGKEVFRIEIPAAVHKFANDETKEQKWSKYVKSFRKENSDELWDFAIESIDKELRFKFYQEIVEQRNFNKEDVIHVMIKDFMEIHWDWEEFFVNHNIITGLDEDCFIDIKNVLIENMRKRK